MATIDKNSRRPKSASTRRKFRPRSMSAGNVLSAGGRWLKRKIWTDRLDHSLKRFFTELPKIIEEDELEC